MRNRKRLLYERRYREQNIIRLRKYRRSYELKNKKRISVYRKRYKIRYKKEHPIKDARSARNTALKRRFGIDRDKYLNLLVKQGLKCAICPTTPYENGKELAVDHCHKSQKIRGLLCAQCNTGLGMFRDNKMYLRKAIQYLCY